MTNKTLKEAYLINEEKIDNGYRQPKTLRYTRQNSKAIIEIDSDNYFGEKCYVMTINGRLAENFFGKTLFWQTLEQAKKDIVRIFYNQMPCEYYTMTI